jgi:hypothetical protein
MIAFEVLKLPQEFVELCIRNCGVLMNVVALLVLSDLLAELVDASGGIHVRFRFWVLGYLGSGFL